MDGVTQLYVLWIKFLLMQFPDNQYPAACHFLHQTVSDTINTNTASILHAGMQ